MPVGHEVTATRCPWSGAPAAAGVGAPEAVAVAADGAEPAVVPDDAAPSVVTVDAAAAVAAAAALIRQPPTGQARQGAGLITPETSATTSPGSLTLRRASVRSLRTRARASFVSSLRCSSSPAAGAAIMKTRSAGPSLAPKSTGSARRANASVASDTCGDLQCGAGGSSYASRAGCCRRPPAAGRARRARSGPSGRPPPGRARTPPARQW